MRLGRLLRRMNKGMRYNRQVAMEESKKTGGYEVYRT